MPVPPRTALVVLIGAAAGLASVPLAGQTTDRVARLVAQMTLDEKIAMLHGASDPDSQGQAGYLPGVPRLGIPPLRLTDGPAGVRTARPATALPAPVALASTFSPDLARTYGRIIARDGRARGQNVILAPMVNIVRVPQAGRNFETLGEDPYLASRMVAAEVDGIQREGLIATVKHFALNNQENQRNSVSADADEQTMHEIELPGFEAAVRAGAGAVMAAYNRVNGTYAAENPMLLTDVLRDQWRFGGFVMSDWGATHSGVPALTAGLELEMPSGRNYGTLAEAVASGELTPSIVDRAVTRILTSMDRAGLLDAGPPRPMGEIPVSSPEARDIAVAGAVLLQNTDDLLPLSRADMASLAVIGPTARTLLVGGGGSARVQPMHTERPFDLIVRRAGAGAKVSYAVGYDLDGTVVPSSALAPEGEPGRHGLPRSTQGGVTTAVDPTIDFIGARTIPAGETWIWTGTIAAPAAGDYQLVLHTAGGRGSIQLDAPADATPAGRAGRGGAGRGGRGGGRGGRGGGFGGGLIGTADGLNRSTTPATFEVGTPRRLTVTAAASASTPMQIRLAWITPELPSARIQEAAQAARSARAAVVFAYDEGSEGRDRPSLSLPGNQDALIAAVAAANPRTVVVLNNGAPILMPWAHQVKSILQMWYPGQEGAEATAALLTGEASPGGRLPVTFPRRAEDAPTAPPERYPGVDGHGAYSEGILVGYRWYDHEGIDPLFAFGHGLAYTTFAYSGFAVAPRADGGFDATFTVRNTGTREGTDVPQVYVSPSSTASGGDTTRKLIGFQRVTLAPGASTQLRLTVTAQDVSSWSVAEHRWVPLAAAGHPLTFSLGASSRDIRATAAARR